MRDSVPSGSYSSVCNVLRQWNISLIPTYRVYRLYDIESTDSMILCPINCTHPQQCSPETTPTARCSLRGEDGERLVPGVEEGQEHSHGNQGVAPAAVDAGSW